MSTHLCHTTGNVSHGTPGEAVRYSKSVSQDASLFSRVLSALENQTNNLPIEQTALKMKLENKFKKITRELSVRRSFGSEFGHQFAVGLEDEDAAGFVVGGDDVAVFIDGDTFRSHQFPGANLILPKYQDM